MNGIRCSPGMPLVDCAELSLMMPAMAIVSPSCTVTCVLTLRRENEGDWIWPPAGGAWGALTS